MAVQWALTANQYALRRAWRRVDISSPLLRVENHRRGDDAGQGQGCDWAGREQRRGNRLPGLFSVLLLAALVGSRRHTDGKDSR
ncbi:MAG: hypothetical protein IPM84_25185 [Anaerolineae bacterium]|nr:hypothetical protein [Anaerolineae bacterium]